MTPSAEKLLAALETIYDVFGKDTFGTPEIYRIGERVGIKTYKFRKSALKTLVNEEILVPQEGALWTFSPEKTRAVENWEREAYRRGEALKRAIRILATIRREIVNDADASNELNEVASQLENVMNDVKGIVDKVREPMVVNKVKTGEV